MSGDGLDNKVEHLVGIVDRDQLAADIEVEYAFFPTHAHPGELGGGDQQGGLGPCPCTVSTETPAAAAIFASVVRA